MPRIVISSHGEQIQAKSEGYLAGDQFNAYREIMKAAGMRWAPEIKSYTAIPMGIGKLIAAIEKARFQYVITPEAQKLLERSGAVSKDGTTTVEVVCDDRIIAQLTPAPNATVKVQVQGRMPDEVFAQYRQIKKEQSWTFNQADRTDRFPVSRLGEAVLKLRELGFLVNISPSLNQEIEKEATKIREQRKLAETRLSEAAERGIKLRDYQKIGIEWLSPRRGAILADDMGLGKTVQALMSVPTGAPVVVICPAVAKGVWRNETRLWRPDLSPTTLEGRGSFRWPAPGEVIVTNYQILPDTTFKEKAPEGTVLICDEAHNLKEMASARTKKVFHLAKEARQAHGKVWLVTGTPILNRPSELWTLLELSDTVAESFVNEDRFSAIMGGKIVPVFNKYGKQAFDAKRNKLVTRRVYDPDQIDSGLAGKLLQRVMLRRLKADVAKDLPQKSYKEVFVDLVGPARKHADRIKEAVAKKYGNLTDDKAIEKFLQDAPRMDELSRMREVLARVKGEAVLELVEEYEEAGEPVIVTSAHREPIDKFKAREGWAVLTGDTTHQERTEIQRAFQAGELKGVAMTTMAGGVAITLTRASHMIFIDHTWVPAIDQQAEDRIHRIGQDRPCLYTNLICDHEIDHMIHRAWKTKRALVERTIEQATRSIDAQSEEADEAAQLDKILAGLVSDEIEACPVVRVNVIGGQARPDEYFGGVGLFDDELRPETITTRKGRTVKLPASKELRPASTAIERWAIQGLERLALNDEDRATEDNGIGFSKSTTSAGHMLVAIWDFESGLTPEQWRAAVEIARYHRRQIGPEPS